MCSLAKDYTSFINWIRANTEYYFFTGVLVDTVDAHIPIKLKTSELDLWVIIGNLFDNAIEASLALPENERVIRVHMDMKNTQLYISFTNFTAVKKQKKINNLFATTKGSNHGLGLIQIDRIIKRLDGYLSRNSEDNAFTTEILIPQI